MGTPERVTAAHRQYNQWVADETLEDFALRYTAKHARRWSTVRIANTALGIVSFLALEAIGGAITLSYGFTNAMWAILCVASIIFISGIPVCYHAAKAGVDIDLLTRGAGFGYIGSTISSLVYASFTFIFFALEAAIMASALELLFNVPISIAYFISAFIVIPLVTHGIKRISYFQLWTQPLWILLQFIPLGIVLHGHADTINDWMRFPGLDGEHGEFNFLYFSAAAAVIFPLIAQNGEQVDYLRFLPERNQHTKAWWAALIFSGPGWVFIGVVKLFVGSFLAYLALQSGISADKADDPTHMYLIVFNHITDNPSIAIWVAGIFVIISQLKINVTNAYAGSIAWSNFFSRLTNNHPGRIVWVFFNVTIALILMELGLYKAFEQILITYAALVLSWFGALVADLSINMALGLRPKKIEFKRGHLYDINPVGFFSMIIASFIGISSEFGIYGDTMKALAPFLAFFLPFITVPFIAWLTKGKYYLARVDVENIDIDKIEVENIPHKARCTCEICTNEFDGEDSLHCPYYGGTICSLCCSLESLCENQCRPKAHGREQIFNVLGKYLPGNIISFLQTRSASFLVTFASTLLLIASMLSLVSYTLPVDYQGPISDRLLWQVFFLFAIVAGILVWLYILADASKNMALTELKEKALELEFEVQTHRHTSKQLAAAKQAADSANQSKTRYLSAVSHELRTPLNTMMGYAQLLESNRELDDKTHHSVATILRSSEHLADVIEGLLEVSKIEAKRLEYIHNDDVNIRTLLEQINNMFSTQAHAKQLKFEIDGIKKLPTYVVTDAKRIRQILINLIGNAIKFTDKGFVKVSISYRNEVAKFTIEDSGSGIKEDDLVRIYEPFEQGEHDSAGSGLGLAITKLLIELMGGDIRVESELGKGSCFTLSLLLPKGKDYQVETEAAPSISGYHGKRKTILTLDDQLEHRQLLSDILSPLGFTVLQAENSEQVFKIANVLPIDCFLLDIFLPKDNGWDIAKGLRARGISKPIIMVSANAMENQAEEIRAQVHNDYIFKPIEVPTLLDKLADALHIEWIFDTDIAESNAVTEQDASNTSSEQTDQEITWPETAVLSNIKQYASIGYLKGIELEVEQLSGNPELAEFYKTIKQHIINCDIAAISQFLDSANLKRDN